MSELAHRGFHLVDMSGEVWTMRRGGRASALIRARLEGRASFRTPYGASTLSPRGKGTRAQSSTKSSNAPLSTPLPIRISRLPE